MKEVQELCKSSRSSLADSSHTNKNPEESSGVFWSFLSSSLSSNQKDEANSNKEDSKKEFSDKISNLSDSSCKSKNYPPTNTSLSIIMSVLVETWLFMI